MGVSVIIPTYNDGYLLVRALESVIIQTDVEFEIVIIQDRKSSTQCTQDFWDVYEKYSYKIKYVETHNGNGAAFARNFGIAHAKYDWILPLDADDFFHDVQSIARLWEVKKKNNGVDCFYGQMLLENGLVTPPEDVTYEMQHEANYLYASSMFSRHMWEKVGGYTVRSKRHYEDWNFWLKALSIGCKFKYVPGIVYVHTNRPENVRRDEIDRKEELKKFARYLP